MVREADFKKVYQEYHPRVLNYITRLTGNFEAEDITQEVFEKISRGLKGFKGESKLSTWIYRIATNTALDKVRSSSFKRTTNELTEREEDRNVWTSQKKPPVDQQLIRKEMSECVIEHIDKLSAGHKTVILLREIEGFSNKEIADILHISLETVKIRLHRARERLKKILDEACDFYHNEQSILACDRKPHVIKFKKPR
jgi:RNA polymerase sigma-70 factor (ECF subfamily)